MESLTFDLRKKTVRELNEFLHREAPGKPGLTVRIKNPDGAHCIGAGVDAEVKLEIEGHAGYYGLGMNERATTIVHGNAGPAIAENMMSGHVHVKGFASVAAGASGNGGLLTINRDASLRCGISMKGIDIVVGGNVGDFSGFMAQAGRMVICGDAGDALGDSLYEAVIYVRGSIKSLGADAHEEEMTAADRAAVHALLFASRIDADPAKFRRIASMRSLYHWNEDANQEY